MTWIAWKMLSGDRSKYLAIVFGVTFACFLIAEQSDIFCGVMLRTTGQIRETRGADIWVMSPGVRYVDDLKAIFDTDVFRVRSVPGVAWAVNFYRGVGQAQLADGTYQGVILMGVDDAPWSGADAPARRPGRRLADPGSRAGGRGRLPPDVAGRVRGRGAGPGPGVDGQTAVDLRPGQRGRGEPPSAAAERAGQGQAARRPAPAGGAAALRAAGAVRCAQDVVDRRKRGAGRYAGGAGHLRHRPVEPLVREKKVLVGQLLDVFIDTRQAGTP
jgi:hypothetical protein